MLLSDAIRQGMQLRGESHSGPFTRIANTEELRSDVWGAACEAVHSLVAKRNWDRTNQLAYDTDIEYLRAIQFKYFANYFKMPATCPGAKSREVKRDGGRFTGRVVNGLNEFIVERESHESIGPVTSICTHVSNVAELVEHFFYVHNRSREECAQVCEWFEQQAAPLVVQHFEHYQDSAIVNRAAQRLTAAAVTRQQQRQQRRAYFPLH